MRPDDALAAAEAIVTGHQERMVADLMDALTAALVRGGELTIADERALETAAAWNREAVARILATHSPRISAQTRRIVTAALVEADTGDVQRLAAFYATPVPPGSSAAFARAAAQTAEGVARTIARNNLGMAANAQRVWRDVAAEAIGASVHGALPIDRVMSRAVTRMAREGVMVIDYDSGARTSVDAAVRRTVVTEVTQAAARQTLARIGQYGHDLVETSSHFGSRPDHAEWQGQVFSVSGTSREYPAFYPSTGYGDAAGLGGINCRHSVSPFFPGISEIDELPETVDGKTSDEMYAAQQRQRTLERAVRDAKRDAAALKAAGLDDTNARLTLGARQTRLREYARSEGLTRQPQREKVYAIGAQPRARTRV